MDKETEEQPAAKLLAAVLLSILIPRRLDGSSKHIPLSSGIGSSRPPLRERDAEGEATRNARARKGGHF